MSKKWNLKKDKNDDLPDEKQMKEYAEKAGRKAEYPWNDPGVRDEQKIMVPLYLPEPYKLKLKYLAEQTGIPQQRILRDMLLPLIDERINHLIGEE